MRSRLIKTALLYNMDAHHANPVNLLAGALGMFVNNTIFLVGIWGMLFAGKTKNAELLAYFIALYAIVTASWGAVNFFFGGLRFLGDYITEGTLEPMLATPRDPILLAAISRSSPMALGDLVMGFVGIFILGIKLDPSMAARSILAAIISAVGFAALFISAGALSFFIPRGNSVGQLFIEITLSLSVYPTGKMFDGTGRIFLLLTPAAATAVLPLDIVESAGLMSFLIAIFSAALFFTVSVCLFRLGVRRYKAVSVIGLGGGV